ncbi:MAG TPA: HAD family hydrolase [Candidatus Acidoferrales bacterium]|jgi:phosphoserine phosphatase|nr:HAD family hydrolase [Candidatus Acidoferrales bacterium]
MRILRLAAAFGILLYGLAASPAADPLPSWNDGPAKTAIVNFVHVTTDPSSPQFVPAEQRLATFDQDGTLWVEHPIYTQFMFVLSQIAAMAPQHPAWKTTPPFKAVLDRDEAAMVKFTQKDLVTLLATTSTGISMDAFHASAKAWIAQARDRRWKRHYNELIYQPMLEAMRYLRANGYKTYIVTGGGQEFVRAFSMETYGVPVDQVIGSTGETKFVEKNGQTELMKLPKLQLNNDKSGKPEDIYLFIGRKPQAAFGNSTGDQQMLEYAQSSPGAHLEMLVLHDDATREYAYGPAAGLPNTKVGTFTQNLYDYAKANGWIVISMKNDWKRIFSFDP